MADEKDRLGDRLQERERAAEEKYFAEQNKAAVERLRAQQAAGQAPAGTCPRCAKKLVEVDHVGVRVDRCPDGHGMWLDAGEFELIAQREKDSWLGRLFGSMPFGRK